MTKETQEMRLKIEEELGLDPVDKSVIVLYDGERQEQVGKRKQIDYRAGIYMYNIYSESLAYYIGPDIRQDPE